MVGLGFLLVFGVVLFLHFIQHMREQRVYAVKLQVYHNHGGISYISQRFWNRKDITWEHQQEINRRAREIAGL